jgi:stage II sporulation protein D
LRILSEQGEYYIPAKDVRKSLGWDRLPSTSISTITQTGDTCVIEGRGYGHGVGMCQWTALKLAKAGMSYREILSRFYPGAVIQIYEAQ